MSVDAPTALLAVDGLAPRSIAEPASVDEVASALREANERGEAVIPWGAGQHMSLGNIPARYDLALRMTKLDRVLEYEPADLTITVESGITMGRLQSVLAEHGEFLPIDAPAEATAGGVLSAGLSGPSAHAYGLPRDWLIGCKIALADGTIVKAGGRVVKNVAGYDMQKLVVGSIGTLGVIAEATFKVAPLPPAQETLLATFSTVDEAAAAVHAADERSLALRALAVLRQAQDDPRAAFWLSGPQSAVERTRRELGEVCGAARTERLEGEASARWWAELGELEDGMRGVSLRASLLPRFAIPFAEYIAAEKGMLGAHPTSVVYPTTGVGLSRLTSTRPVTNVPEPGFMNTLDEDFAYAARAAGGMANEPGGGALIVTSAPVEVKRMITVWSPSLIPTQASDGAFRLMRRLKEQFDPRDTLNPGRYVRVM